MLLSSTEVWFVSRGRRRAHEGGHRPLRILLARFVLSATAVTTPLQFPLRHSAPNGTESPTLSETGASTPFSRSIETRKSSVHVTSRKSAGASSPSCTNTRSPRTTSIASMSFQAPSRRTHASSVIQRAYARIDGSDDKQGSKQQTTAGQSHGGLGLFGPSRAKRSRASAHDRPFVLPTSISSTSSSWIAELVALIAASSTDFSPQRTDGCAFCRQLVNRGQATQIDLFHRRHDTTGHRFWLP